MQITLGYKKILTLLFLNLLYPLSQVCAAQEGFLVKKRKIDCALTNIQYQCLCCICNELRTQEANLEKTHYKIVQALLLTPLPTVLIDTIYDYVWLGQKSLLSFHISDPKKGENAYGVIESHTISKVYLACQQMILWDKDKGIGVNEPHIAPQEITFDSCSFLSARTALNDFCATKSGTVTSLCQRYRLEFSWGKIVVSSNLSRLSNSSGGKKALEEFNKQKIALQ